MPVINWDAMDSPVMNKGFNYYWAVTLPLTLLVLASWGLAMLFPWKKWTSRMKGNAEMGGQCGQ